MAQLLRPVPARRRPRRAVPASRTLVAGVSAACALALGPALAQPEHDCERPEVPERLETQAEREAFVARAEAYLDCLKTFFEEQARIAKEAAEAANAARDEMTEFAAEVNAR